MKLVLSDFFEGVTRSKNSPLSKMLGAYSTAVSLIEPKAEQKANGSNNKRKR
jgi:hypothetical protein